MLRRWCFCELFSIEKHNRSILIITSWSSFVYAWWHIFLNLILWEVLPKRKESNTIRAFQPRAIALKSHATGVGLKSWKPQLVAVWWLPVLLGIQWSGFTQWICRCNQASNKLIWLPGLEIEIYISNKVSSMGYRRIHKQGYLIQVPK